MSARLLKQLCLWSLAFIASTVFIGNAQTPAAAATQQAGKAYEAQFPLCDSNLIDGTFTFADQTAGEQTVSFHFQNKSPSSCLLQGQVSSSFAVDGHSMVVDNCWLCGPDDKPSGMPDRQLENHVLLAPNGRATLDVQWASEGASCQWADWANFFFYWTPLASSDYKKLTSYLFVPSEWPMHICSAARSSGYRAAPEALSTETASYGRLNVSAPNKAIYDDERVTLHVELAGQKTPSYQLAGCADIYMVRQLLPPSGTRFEPLRTLTSHAVPSFTQQRLEEDQNRPWPSWKTDHLRKCNIDAGQTAVDAEISASDLADVTHIEWRMPPVAGKAIFLTASTHFTVLDMNTLTPNWGDTVEGIHAGLSIDHTSFTEGEAIPLHFRWENVNASRPLGEDECAEPVPSLEIQDSDHKLMRTVPLPPMCMGHGWGPFLIEKGKAQHNFRDLGSKHLWGAPSLILQPGIYYLVSVWSPHVLEGAVEGIDPRHHSSIGDRGHMAEVYATARSIPVRIEILHSSGR